MHQFIVIVLLVAYLGGIWRFWKGFRQTNFGSSLPNKLFLSLLWPVLLVANKSYRQNFRKALKGR